MCFEVPGLVPPGDDNGNKTGHEDDANDDDLGIMDIDGTDDNDAKFGIGPALSSSSLFILFHLDVMCDG